MRTNRSHGVVTKAVEQRACFALLAVLGLIPIPAPLAQEGGAAPPAAAADETTSEREAKCESAVSVSYEQWNTSARVEGTIENSTCGASRGDYTLLVSVRDDAGESKVIEIERSWQREDNQPVVFQEQVPIGDDVELRRVRARSNHCVCVEVAGG
ncbi:MAG: hypothetical protein IT494_04850 [Gammaproteobacteria bacterium]|nr:hypothetical protein [Gammaproteobacteria bacterium]